jgi:hypothetical protein
LCRLPFPDFNLLFFAVGAARGVEVGLVEAVGVGSVIFGGGEARLIEILSVFRA